MPFDLEKARKNGISEFQIDIMRGINENNEKEQSCSRHEFERVKINGLPKYQCKNCGCIENAEFVCGYRRGLEHGKIT